MAYFWKKYRLTLAVLCFAILAMIVVVQNYQTYRTNRANELVPQTTPPAPEIVVPRLRETSLKFTINDQTITMRPQEMSQAELVNLAAMIVLCQQYKHPDDWRTLGETLLPKYFPIQEGS